MACTDRLLPIQDIFFSRSDPQRMEVAWNGRRASRGQSLSGPTMASKFSVGTDSTHVGRSYKQTGFACTPHNLTRTS